MESISTDNDINEAAEIFKTAFINYPLYTYLFPHLSQREKTLPILFKISAKYLSERVYCIRENNKMLAVLLVDSPSHKTPSLLTYLSIFKIAITKLPLKRSIKMLKVLNEISSAQPKNQFYYIQTIAVHPKAQGKGLGKKVIDFVINLSNQSPIYLETNSPNNVAYYLKRGFKLYNEFKCDNGKGPTTWSFTQFANEHECA